MDFEGDKVTYMKIPTIAQAESMLKEAEKLNPGPWVAHNKVAGLCGGKIAEKCVDLDSEAAYVLGLLHDIGRRFGASDMKHIIDGYRFLIEQGFDVSARICLTHSFPLKNINSCSGVNDCTKAESEFIQSFLDRTEYDDYDRLIQLCDALSYPTGACYIEKRLVDVTIRRGFNDFTIPKWKEFFKLKEYFDNKAGCDIYELIGVK
jgi:hypothetical protein